MNWSIAQIADIAPAEYAAAYAALSPSRQAHIDSFRHPGAKKQSLAGEVLLRRLLAEMGVTAPIERLPSGQPVLQGSDHHVSIAHCEEFVVCAIHPAPVGIDIEKIKAVKPGMIQKVCTPEESRYVQDDPARFFEIWTGKEAYFKMRGTGITNFQSINILPLNRKCFRRGEYLIQIVYEE